MCALCVLEMLFETPTANREEAAEEVLLFWSLPVKQTPLWKSLLQEQCSWDKSLWMNPGAGTCLYFWITETNQSCKSDNTPSFHCPFLHSCSSLLAGKWERIITGGWNRHWHYQKALTARKQCCVPLPCGTRQNPCIITIQRWRTSAHVDSTV